MNKKMTFKVIDSDEVKPVEKSDEDNDEKVNFENNDAGGADEIEQKEKAPTQEVDISDEQVINYFKLKHSKEIESIDDLFKNENITLTDDNVLSYLNSKSEDSKFDNLNEILKPREPKNEELPQHIQGYLEFYNKTGGNFENYTKLNKDYTDKEDELLNDYYKTLYPNLTKDERSYKMRELYVNEDDYESETELSRAKMEAGIKRKEEIYKAKNHIEQQRRLYYKEMQAKELLTNEDKDVLAAFKNIKEKQAANDKARKKIDDAFVKKSQELLNTEFKGFKLKVGDNDFNVNAKSDEVWEQNSNPYNFLSKYIDDKGFVKDVEGYHKALFIANNPDVVMNYMYEQGKADAIEGKSRKKETPAISAKPKSTTFGSMKMRIIE
jgi:hypothetical protein